MRTGDGRTEGELLSTEHTQGTAVSALQPTLRAVRVTGQQLRAVTPGRRCEPGTRLPLLPTRPRVHAPTQPAPGLAASFAPSPRRAPRGGPEAGRARRACLFFLFVEEKGNLGSILCFKSKISPQT